MPTEIDNNKIKSKIVEGNESRTCGFDPYDYGSSSNKGSANCASGCKMMGAYDGLYEKYISLRERVMAVEETTDLYKDNIKTTNRLAYICQYILVISPILTAMFTAIILYENVNMLASNMIAWVLGIGISAANIIELVWLPKKIGALYSKYENIEKAVDENAKTIQSIRPKIRNKQ